MDAAPKLDRPPLRIRNARLDSGVITDLSLRDGIISDIKGLSSHCGSILDAGGRLVVPGFIELQVNGAGDVDFTSRPDAIWRGCARLGSQGITSVLPTVITSPAEVRATAMATIAATPADYVGPRVLGLHFEGPWIAGARRGAHPEAALAGPDASEVASWKHVRMVTLAPECVPRTLIRSLVDADIIVALGHTDATYDEATAAFDNGARYVTHLFNAMRPLHHREPGVVGAALSDPRVTVGLIADGHHVHPTAVALAYRLAAGRLNLVSDAIALDGNPNLGGQSPTLVDGVPRLPDGTLAGSRLTLDAAIRNLRQFTRCSVAEALAAVTSVPARLLGRDSKIAVGSPADLVVLNDDLTVAATVADGRIIFER